MTVIAVSNQKGGVGKTTIAICLSCALAEQGRRVLLIDTDPQCSATLGCGLDPDQVSSSLHDVLTGRRGMELVLISTSWGFDVAPSSPHLVAAELELLRRPDKEKVLEKAIEPLRDKYDFIFLDCQPSLSYLPLLCWAASDYVLIPVSDAWAVKGLSFLFDNIRKVKAALNPELQILGVVLNRLNPHTVHSHELSEGIRRALNQQVRVFDTEIRESTKFKESALHGVPLLVYAPHHPGAEAFRQLAAEILGVIANEKASAQRV